MKQQNKIFSNNLCHAVFTLARCANSQIKKIFMSPDKLVDENDPSTWVAKTKVAPVKFTK